jgi:hypothetical protein
MKSPLALFLASFLAAPLLFAEGNGAAYAPPAQTAAANSETGGIPLMPPTPPADGATPDAGQKKHNNNKKAGPSKTDAAEDAMQLHIKMRAAKTKAMEDPVIQAEYAKAGQAKNDYDRREAYKRYYVMLYSRMIQIDPTIGTGVAARESLSYSRNYQYRVFPTVPKDQVNQSTPTGPENAVAPVGSTPPPRRGFRGMKMGQS